MQRVLNLFYAEPEGDRWLPFDRYPRRVVRRIVRGRGRISGHRRMFLNLCAGLDRLGVVFRVNDFRHAANNPAELACIVGPPGALDAMAWKNPILFGAAVFSHPVDDPALFARKPVRKVLVPGPWMRDMFRAVWDAPVEAWPVGIDTDRWQPSAAKTVDVLIYDKVRWDHARYETELIAPVRAALQAAGRTLREIRYGSYEEDEFAAALRQCRAMVFLCEHETQGIAYQQALSCGVPIFAWDRGGYWQDPNYFPARVKYAPVTSVPYWDARCGHRFADAAAFASGWGAFWEAVEARRFAPRDYVLENLTLEHCARAYLEHARSVE